MNNILFGSLVEAGLHSQKLEADKNLSRINKKIPALFRKNHLEAKKFTLSALLKEFHL